jgi:hypothetical protein
LSRRRPLPRADAVAALLLAALAIVPDAHAWDPDEVRDLRVTRQSPGVRISWQAPENGADSYVVRRCALASLRVPYYGACIAEGVVALQHDDPAPPGDVFYLVAGVVGGAEGSLGHSDNGINNPPRQAEPCGPQPPSMLRVHVRLREPVEICGTQIVVRYPFGVVTFTDGICVGLTAGFLSQSNEIVPGEITHVCAGQAGQSGPGDVTWLQFEQGECPLSAASMLLLSCLVTDCDGNGHEAQCFLF